MTLFRRISRSIDRLGGLRSLTSLECHRDSVSPRVHHLLNFGLYLHLWARTGVRSHLQSRSLHCVVVFAGLRPFTISEGFYWTLISRWYRRRKSGQISRSLLSRRWTCSARGLGPGGSVGLDSECSANLLSIWSIWACSASLQKLSSDSCLNLSQHRRTV